MERDSDTLIIRGIEYFSLLGWAFGFMAESFFSSFPAGVDPCKRFAASFFLPPSSWNMMETRGSSDPRTLAYFIAWSLDWFRGKSDWSNPSNLSTAKAAKESFYPLLPLHQFHYTNTSQV